jgi:hypothetical protein
MPAIPVYQQQTSASQPFAGSNPTAADFGGLTAAAGARIGAALQDVGAAEHAALRYQELQTAKTWAGSAISRATLDWTQQLDDRKQKAEPGAPGFTTGVLADFDKYATTTVDNAPDALARQFVQQHLDALRTQVGQHAITFQAQQQVAYNVKLATDAIGNWAQVVQQDPSKYGTALQAIGETAPYPGAAEAQKLNDHARLSLTSAAASSVLDRDPYALKDATGKAMGEGGFTGKTGVPWVDDATPDQVRQWNSAAQVKIHQLEAERDRGVLAAEKTAQRTYAAAMDLDDKGQYFSPAFTAQLAADTKGTVYEKDAAALVEQQQVTTGFASAPAAQRRALLQQWQARGSDPAAGTSPEGQKYLEKLQRIDGAILAAQKENPWQAAGMYGQRGIDATTRVPQTPADAIGLIRLRAQQLPALETWTGKPESPLQPQEAHAFGEMLKRLPADQAMPALSQIAATVGDADRLDALAGQLAKGHPALALAMKFGGDQTTAGRYVGTLMLEGAQGLTDKTVKADDMKLSGWKAEIAGLVRGSIGDPKAESEIIDAAYLLRAGMELKGAAPGFSLEDTNRQAVKMLVGVPLERGGVKTLLPRGMDERPSTTSCATTRRRSWRRWRTPAAWPPATSTWPTGRS